MQQKQQLKNMKSKKDFLEIFKQKLGNISVACRAYGIDRTTYFRWYNKDANFKNAADNVKEVRKDFVESALDKKIQEGDTAAIIFALKTLCRDRGYIERMEQDVTVKTEQPLFGDYDDEDTES